MKKKLLTAILAACMAVSLTACGGKEEAAAPASTAEVQEVESEAVETEAVTEGEAIEVPIVVVNGTGVDINALYMSSSDTDEWSEDLLGENYMPHATYLELYLPIDETNLSWDLSVEDSEGNSLDWYGIDISEMPADGFVIELLWDGSEGTANLLEDVSMLEGDYTEATGEELVEGELEVADTSSTLAGTVWIGNDLTVWGFEEDGSTLYLTFVEDEETVELTGEYALATAEDGTTVLAISVPDAELDIQAALTAINADSLEFTDLESGESTSLSPYVE